MRLFLRNCLLVLFLSLPCATQADIARPESLEETLALQLEILRALPEVSAAEIDPADKSIQFEIDGQDGYTAYPDNLHKQLQSAGSDAERQQVADQFANSILSGLGPRDAGEALDRTTLLPVIRAEDFGPTGVDSAQVMVSAPLVGELRVFLVEDLPTSVRYVSPEKLEELEITPEAALALALENFLSRSWEPVIRGDGIHWIELDGNYETTYLLHPDIWPIIAQDLGTVVATAPARDLLIFAPANAENISILRQLAAKYSSESGYAISDQLMSWTGTGWELLP